MERSHKSNYTSPNYVANETILNKRVLFIFPEKGPKLDGSQDGKDIIEQSGIRHSFLITAF